MAGDNRLITENFMRLNFAAYAKVGITPGTDDFIMMDYIHIRTRYNMMITGISADNQLPSQNEVIPPVGGSYQGGIIAYFLQSGDPGYDSVVTHGIIAAAADETVTLPWSVTNILTSATASAINGGATNTPTIVSAMGRTTTYAARTCDEKSLNGYTDWQLPCYYELSILYNNRVAIGGFVAGSYWSSTEASGTNAYTINFAVSNASISSAKSSATKVRAIRYF